MLAQVGCEGLLLLHHLGNHIEQAERLHLLQRRRGSGLIEHVVYEDARDGFPRSLLHLRRVLSDARSEVVGNLEPILGRELDRPEHPGRIVREHDVRITRTPHRHVVQVTEPAPGEVHDLGLLRSSCEVLETPQQRVERELASEQVFFDGRRDHLVRLVPLAFRASVGLLSGVGDLDDLILEVVAIYDPVTLHGQDGDPVLVGRQVRPSRDLALKGLGEPLRVLCLAEPLTERHRVNHHVDVLDGTVDDEVPHSPAYDVDVITHSLPSSHIRQELHQGDLRLMVIVGSLSTGHSQSRGHQSITHPPKATSATFSFSGMGSRSNPSRLALTRLNSPGS